MKVFIIAYIMQFGNNLNLYNKCADKLMYFSFVQLIFTCTVLYIVLYTATEIPGGLAELNM